MGKGPAYGARNVLRLWPNVLEMLRKAAFAETLVQVLGPGCGAVRGLYFDKPPGHSWALPWHRDKTIAVQAHGLIGEFKKPTTKAGVPHVEAPPSILDTMLTARIHLDAMTEKNGPLRVIPGSHRALSDSSRDDQAAVTLNCASGDILLMRPLLLHSSGHSETGHEQHRRILHLEFAVSPSLPSPYAWHDFVAVG
jgi:ectoine hydroxylase-related dioxygenase (phytanoyl-CoA dioxygenase family)